MYTPTRLTKTPLIPPQLRSYPVGLTERAYEGGDDSSARGEEFSTTVPDPLPVFKEFDRDFFQRAIKNASTFSNPARKIVFRIRSHDQGWTTDEVPGMFIAAKTWFDAGIERFDASNSSKYLVQCVTANGSFLY